MTLLAVAVLLQQQGLSVSEGFAIFIAGSIVSAVISWGTNKANAAAWKGAADEKFANIDKNFDGISVEQNNQWSEIRRATSGVARLEGEMKHIRADKAAGHS